MNTLIIQTSSCWKKGEGSEKIQKFEEGTSSKSNKLCHISL